MKPVLEVQNLTKIFSYKGQPDITAVSDISFQIFPGEWVALIGESGSGNPVIGPLKRKHTLKWPGYYAHERHAVKTDLSENADGISNAGRFF